MADGGFNVLVVEDNDQIYKVIKDALSPAEYKIWRVTTGREALNLFKDIYFMAIISEIRLPDIDGLELIKKLRKIEHKINVIALTAYTSVDLGIEALKHGAYAYILKPLNGEEIRIILKRAIEHNYLLIQARQRDHFKDISILDGLTSIYNRRHFHEMLDWEIAHLKRFPQTFTLFMIDIDNFKHYNDVNGHLAGDKILRELSQLLVALTRSSDMVFRYGGEEIAILLPGTKTKESEKVADRLLDGVKTKFPVTISIGAAAFPDDAQTKDDLIMKADKALYRAKAQGKNRLCIFDPNVDK